MNIEDLSAVFVLFTGVFWAKTFLLTFIFFYSILALVAMRQTQLMSRILNEVNFSPFLKFLSFIHFLAAVSVFVLALILLIF